MKHNAWLFLGFLIFLVSCSSNPNKAEKIDTKMENTGAVTGSQQVGVKKGEMVVLDKVQISEKLRDLQNQVYSLEDQTYGTRKLGSLGLFGELKSCKRKLASRQYGGDGTMLWTEPLDRVTDKEDELKLGLDEKQDLVGVSEEYLRDRLQRFTGYKQILQKRSDEFREKIEQCKADLATKSMDESQPSKVMVQEAPKASVDRAAIHAYMCSYVRSGASLQAFMLNVLAKGWLSLADYKMDQNLLSPTVRDVKGVEKKNGLLFNGWKLAYDQSPITVGELLNEGKEAHLVAWSFERKADVTGASSCLSAADGVWNP